MQSLCIYGDSFADPTITGHIDHPELQTKGWPNLLRHHYKVKNYALGGSSLYYSYGHFLRTNHKYDKIVFIATNFNRAPNSAFFSEKHNREFGFNSLLTIENFIKLQQDKINQNLRDKLNALTQYYLHLSDEMIEEAICEALIEKIRRIRPDALIISITYPKKRMDAYMPPPPLSLYTQLLIRSLNPDYLSTYNENGWIRCKEKAVVCHFTPEINGLLATHIKEALDTGVWNPTIPDTIPHEHPWNYYYEDSAK